MKKVNLLLLLLVASTTGLWAQAYNPFTSNIHFVVEPTVQGFGCGTTAIVEFTQGIITADNATPFQTAPLIVKVGIAGFEFDHLIADSIVGGSYSGNFDWSYNTAKDTLIGTQNQVLYGTGPSPIFSDPRASGLINVRLKVPTNSPLSDSLKVDVSLGIPAYMTATNSTPDDIEATRTQSFCELSIRGTVFNDTTVTALTNPSIDKTLAIGKPDGQTLCMNLVSPAGIVLAVAPVDTLTGKYAFLNVAPNQTYGVRLTTTCATVNTLAPTPTLPTGGWENTGEDCCDGNGKDGNNDGILLVPITDVSKENADFGIRDLTPTPIILKDFNLSEINCNVFLSWTTASELNVSHFEIERKNDANSKFEQITKMDAAGFSSTEKLYTYLDKEITESPEAYQYRIRFVDLDGTFSYSKIESLVLTCSGNNSSAQLFPNPTSENINLVYVTNENDVQLMVDVLDITGRVLMSSSKIVNSGTNVINLDVKHLANGQYFVRYNGVETKSTGSIKFIKD